MALHSKILIAPYRTKLINHVNLKDEFVYNHCRLNLASKTAKIRPVTVIVHYDDVFYNEIQSIAFCCFR